MKKLILFLLPLFALAQNPTNFPYGIKNAAATTDNTPAYFTTTQVDGVHKKTPAALIALKTYVDGELNNIKNSISSSFISSNNGYEVTGLNVTVNADWEWQLNGIYYTNISPFNYTTPLCSAGKQRFDIVVLTDIGVQLYTGVESVSNPAIPVYPFDGLLAITFLVTDAGITVTPTPNYELKSNKSDSYTASSSTTYASTKALVDGLAIKINGLGVANYIPRFTASNNLDGFSSKLYDNGTFVGVNTNNPLRTFDVNGNIGISSGNSLMWGWGSVGIRGNADTTLLELMGWNGSATAPALSVVNGLNVLVGTSTDNGVDKLQVNGSISATSYTGSATLTGTPTAPTAIAGTNTTQIATTAFVQSANSAIVVNAINDEAITSAPSQNAVFDALALKANLSNPTFPTGANVTSGSINFVNSGSGISATAGSISLVSNNASYAGWGSNAPIKATLLATNAYTVATLPVPNAATTYPYATVTDALSPTYLSVIVGGGSVVCPVFYNGTAWVAH
jgi:hypothetical protein